MIKVKLNKINIIKKEKKILINKFIFVDVYIKGSYKNINILFYI